MKINLKNILTSSTICLTGLLFNSQIFAKTPLTTWDLGNAPNSGVTEARFPMKFTSIPDDSGLYFAFYLPLIGGSRPYLGFQPKQSEDGSKNYLQFVFSSFSGKAKSSDSQCKEGADNGPGISCTTRHNISLGDIYSIRVTAKPSGSDRYSYSATIHNDTTNHSLGSIGTFTLPISEGGLIKTATGDGNGGFIEPYLSKGCNQKFKVSYIKPQGLVNGQTYTGHISGKNPSSGSCLNPIWRTTSDGHLQAVIE